ncbi:MAG: sialidase family protein [Flavobacteriaceae bacterium]|nr:sialidase family protein [Flavobacteriaceae bacterium]
MKKKYFFNLLFIASFSVHAQSDEIIKELESPPFFESSILFKSERFPNIVVSTNGTVVTTWGKENCVSRRSVDGGKTWEPPVFIDQGINGGGLTVDENSGEIIAFVEKEHPPAALKCYRSKDNGKTWEVSPIKISADKNGVIPSMHMNEHGITLKNEEYKGRLIRPSRFYNAKSSAERKLMYSSLKEKMWKDQYTNAIYSDDGGKTWQTSDPFPAKGTGEAALVELSDGKIYYNSRRHFSSDGLNPRMRHIATSNNGGQNWENLYVSTELPDGEQNRDYGLMAGLDRFSFEGYDILIYSNIVSDGGRKNGIIWLSFDAGKSWPVRKVIEPLGFKYSSLAIGKENTPSEGYVYLLYETGEGENINAYGGGKIARFNLSWILEGKNINRYFN